MLTSEAKKRIDGARQVLVGVLPNPMQQVELITTALIYKFMDDMDEEARKLPNGKGSFFVGELKEYSWHKLMDTRLTNQDKLNRYQEATKKIAESEKIPELFRSIFRNTYLPFNDPRTLGLFLSEINQFDYDNSEELGNAYEYLLSIMGSQGDAGQFRTPRHIIDFIVKAIDPKKEDRILDPACGTAGFLISAYKHILEAHDGIDNKTGKSTDKETPLTATERQKIHKNITGYDIDPNMVKTAKVNTYLHKFKDPNIKVYDTISKTEFWDEEFDIILANPPFMTPRGGIEPHSKFKSKANRAEVLFVDYILEHLSMRGRAGIIVPEGVIFQSANAYKVLRKDLVEDGLYAAVSLPPGVFNPYSGVKTSILLFDKDITKNNKEILFIKIEKDGFDLGAQRRETPDKNDLPLALEILKEWKEKQKVKENQNIAFAIKKSEIAESGDYNLTGDRYKVDLYTKLRSIAQNLEETFKPYEETIKQIQKQTEPYRKLTEQLQKQAEQAISVFDSPMFQEVQKSMQQVAKQMQEAFKNVDFQEIIKQKKRLQEELKKQQKWEMVELGNEIETITPPKKIKKEEYGKSGIYPIIDQSQDEIAGWTDDKGAIVSESKGLVIFGDHTCVIKYTEKKFAQGADGIKILKTKEVLLPKFLYYLLLTNPIKSDGYKRHFTKLKRIKIPLPPLEIQKQIVEELDGYRKVIDGAKQVVENWKSTIKIDPEWEMKKLEDVCVKITDGTHSTPKYKDEGVPFWRVTDLTKSNDSKKFISKSEHLELIKRCNPEKGDILYSKNGTIGVAKLIDWDWEFSIFVSLSLLKPNKKLLLPKYLEVFMNSDSALKQAFARKKTGAITNLHLVEIKSFIIPLPPLETQEKIVTEIETEQKIVDQNKKLIEIFEQKIKTKISEIWGK